MYSLVGMSICIQRGSEADPRVFSPCAQPTFGFLLFSNPGLFEICKRYGWGMFQYLQIFKKIKHQRVDIFKLFLVTPSLSDRRGNHTDTLVHTEGWELARASATPRVSLSIELLLPYPRGIPQLPWGQSRKISWTNKLQRAKVSSYRSFLKLKFISHLCGKQWIMNTAGQPS